MTRAITQLAAIVYSAVVTAVEYWVLIGITDRNLYE